MLSFCRSLGAGRLAPEGSAHHSRRPSCFEYVAQLGEGVLTLSGKGQWQKGTIANLLTKEE
jgi:hypothetical protein